MLGYSFGFDQWVMVVMVFMKLHKLSINRIVSVPNHRFVRDVREGDKWVVYDNGREDYVLFLGELVVMCYHC